MGVMIMTLIEAKIILNKRKECDARMKKYRDRCGSVINDQDEKNRKESEYEIHIVRVEHEPEEKEVRKNFDLCWRCIQDMRKLLSDPTLMHRFMMKEGYY
jgi:hypothetical protein